MFNLANYEREIRNGATKAGISDKEALSKFIYNLAVMRPHFTIFDSALDFRVMGQEWNALSSDTRNAQKQAVFSKPTRVRSLGN